MGAGGLAKRVLASSYEFIGSIHLNVDRVIRKGRAGFPSNTECETSVICVYDVGVIFTIRNNITFIVYGIQLSCKGRSTIISETLPPLVQGLCPKVEVFRKVIVNARSTMTIKPL